MPSAEQLTYYSLRKHVKPIFRVVLFVVVIQLEKLELVLQFLGRSFAILGAVVIFEIVKTEG